MKQITIGKTVVTALRGDITKIAADAVVNAANSRLAGGGGVDGAIHNAGGPEIMKACDAIRAAHGGCATGGAVLTTAGRLPARHVIHAVGPIWNAAMSADCDRLLKSAYYSSLSVAKEHDLKTIAFPSLSTGIYGFPIERAAPLAVRTVRDYLLQHPFEEIKFVLFSEADLAVYVRALS